MKVKYIKEGYFHTPEEMKNKAKKSNAEIVSKEALKIRKQELEEMTEAIVKKFYPNSYTYAFYSNPVDLYRCFEGDANAWFKDDFEIQYICNMEAKTMEVTIYYGARKTYKPDYVITDQKGNNIETVRMVFNSYSDIIHWIKPSVHDEFLQHPLSERATRQMHHLANMMQRLNFESQEKKKEFDLCQELQEYSFIVNKIHMFPKLHGDIILEIGNVYKYIPGRSPEYIKWSNDDIEALVEFIHEIFSFDNDDNVYLRYFDTSKYKNFVIDTITDPKNIIKYNG